MRNKAIKMLVACVMMTGQLMAAQSSYAVPDIAIQEEMQKRLQSYLGDKGLVENVEVSTGVSRAFSSCDDVEVELVHPVRNIHRPSYHISCTEGDRKRRARGVAHGTVDVIIARLPLSRGRMLLGSDIESKKIHLSEYRSGMLFDRQSAFGRALRTPLKKGRPLTDSLLDKKYDILTGQSADLSISRQGIFFSIPVEALESGRVGDTIPVRNESSGKVFEVTIGENGQLKL